MKKIMLSILAVFAVSATALAQGTATYSLEQKVASDQTPQILLDKIARDQTTISFQVKATPDAPYSAEATTESVMTLADGNRIVKRTTTRVYRDSAGRTRRETLGADGQVESVVISDPTAKTGFSLDPHTQTASRTSVLYFVSHASSDPVAGGTLPHITSAPSGGTVTVSTTTGDASGQVKQVQRSVVVTTAGEGPVFKVGAEITTKGETTKEDLGEQTIEGVLAKGTRTTTILPAGAVDNEQPIRIVSEEWFSPDLQVLVLTRHSDPRVGETTYRLGNVTRTEPAPSLFELPAGYTVKTPEPGVVGGIIKR